jgi:RecA-family ATPase
MSVPDPQPPTDFIVDEVLPCEEVHLIGGPSGAGKTAFLFQLIDDIRSGRDVFGRRSHMMPYVYVSCDRSHESINRKLVKFGLQDSITNIIALPDFIDSENPLETIINQLPEGTKIIFIEGFALLIRGDSNSYGAVGHFLANAVKLCKKHHVTIIGTVHSTKARSRDVIYTPRERILGSVAWGACSETIIYIDPADLADSRNVDRRIFLFPRNVRNEQFDYCFDAQGRLVPVADQVLSNMLELELLRIPIDGVITRAQVMEWADRHGMSHRTAEYWMKDMTESGVLKREQRGSYRKAFGLAEA